MNEFVFCKSLCSKWDINSSSEICEPFCVSTPIGESILEEGVYRDCPVSINHKITMADLVDLDMVDLDVLLDMD